MQAIIDQIKPNLAYTAAIQALPGTAPVAHDVAAKVGADQPVVKQRFVAGHVEMSCEKHHEAEVGDRRVRDELLDVGLCEGDQRAVHDADDGEDAEIRRDHARGPREHREREAQQAIAAELEHDGREDDGARSRRLDVGIGQPGVERKQRDLDAEGERKGEEAEELRSVRQDHLAQRLVVERPHAGERVVLHVEVKNRDDHEQRADHRVDDELDGRVETTLTAPDPDDEVHRDEHHFPEDVEEEQVERGEGADHAGLEDEQRDDELAHLLVDREPRARDDDGHEERGEQDEPQRDAVDAQVKAHAQRLDPRDVHDVGEAGGVEAEQAEGDEERERRQRERGPLQQPDFFLREHEEQDRAGERQEGGEGQQHQFTVTELVTLWDECQRGSVTSTVIFFSPVTS